MLRLLLVLSFLASLALLGVSQFMVKPQVDEIRTRAESAEKDRDTAQAAKADAEKKAKEATAAAEKAGREATQAKNELETVSKEATEQRARAGKLDDELRTTTKAKNDAQSALAQWEALGIRPDGINKLKADARKAQEERAAIADENKILNRDIKYVRAKLARYEGESSEVELPAGLKGTITAVSPGSDFVFLNIGANQGLIERGKLIVRRGDKLITKVQIVSVAENHAIANVMSTWTQGNATPQIGDAVLY